MSALARKPLAHPVLIAAVIVLCLLLIVSLVSFAVPFRVAAQAYALILVLLAFRYWPPLIRLVRGMPIPHRAVFGLIIAAMILGHFTLRARTFFPFVAWEIFPFAREEDPVTCRELIATTQTGAKVRLLVEQLFPSIVQFNLPDDANSPAMTALVQALAKIYNRRHPADPVRSVDLMVLAVKLHPPATESRSEPSCEFLQRYDVSSVPSN